MLAMDARPDKVGSVGSFRYNAGVQGILLLSLLLFEAAPSLAGDLVAPEAAGVGVEAESVKKGRKALAKEKGLVMVPQYMCCKYIFGTVRLMRTMSL